MGHTSMCIQQHIIVSERHAVATWPLMALVAVRLMVGLEPGVLTWWPRLAILGPSGEDCDMACKQQHAMTGKGNILRGYSL